ncbi:hypothetical protein [Acinetobacter bereziniae]|uniref:hypothetical protein n=1 Tax=Acinetobacter bereziniae TaxID=106648 RepID=UPI0021E44D6C|nr:hypothetical protein [Acinetobacter bereziniae]MCV2444761.1 hypothetical protein [Acinetobacter bereziniae]
MGSLQVQCVGGIHDGKTVSINSSENDYFKNDFRVFSIVVDSVKPMNEKAFNNLNFSVITTHVNAALNNEASIDVYYLQGDNNSKPEEVFYKYEGRLTDILKQKS